MAFVPLVPVALNPILTQGHGQQFNAPLIQSPAGANIDLSAWVSLVAKIIPTSPNPTGSDASFGTVAAAAGGVLTLTTSPTDLASVAPGSARLVISGKPTSGDTDQLLASGVITVQAG